MRERRGRGKRGGRGEKYGIWLFSLAWQILATMYIGELLGTVCNSNAWSVGFIGSSRKHVSHTHALQLNLGDITVPCNLSIDI
jgi:hypothetical protein